MFSLLVICCLNWVICLVYSAFFFWAVDSGQYDDLDGPAHSILFDDQDPRHQAAVKPDDAAADTDKEPPPRA